MRIVTILAASALALTGCQSSRSSTDYTGSIARPCASDKCRSFASPLGPPSNQKIDHQAHPFPASVVTNICVPAFDAAVLQGSDRQPLAEMIAMPISVSPARDAFNASIQSNSNLQLPSDLARWRENRSAENQLTAFAPPPVIDIEAIRSALSQPLSSWERDTGI